MKKRLQTFLFWFILVQPFLDIYWLSRPPLLKFSIPTILRVLGVFIAIILFFSIKNNWQRFRKQWWIIAYIGPNFGKKFYWCGRNRFPLLS